MAGPLVIPVPFLWLVRPFTYQHALHALVLTACQEIVMVQAIQSVHASERDVE